MNTSFANHGIIKRYGEGDFLANQRIAGKAVAECLSLFKKKMASPEPLNLLQIEQDSAEIIERRGCTPTFHKYKGFSGKVCLSVNKVMVHGIPYDYQIQEGDLVSLDLGATCQGAIADAATTCIRGSSKHQKMVETCQEALRNAIANIKVGEPIGRVGNAIHRTVRNTSFGLITTYGGHGIALNTPHADPFVSNKSSGQDGPLVRPGMTFAIEPMLVEFDRLSTSVLTDGWSVVTLGMSCHEEHTVFIHDNSVEIITS